MKKKQLAPGSFTLLAFLIVLLALAGCQTEGQLDEAVVTQEATDQSSEAEEPTEAESTLEVKQQMTAQPEPSATSSEAPVEDPTEVPAEEGMSDVDPTPTEVPAISGTEMKEYVSSTEFFSLKVPSGWSSEETLPGAAFIAANSEEALARYHDDSAFEPGDFVINVGFIPSRLLQTNELRNLNFAYDASPDVFLQSLLPMFRTTGETVLSDVERVSLSEKIDAGRVTVSGAGREGLVKWTSTRMWPTPLRPRWHLAALRTRSTAHCWEVEHDHCNRKSRK
jgi:hypothetical protein